MSISDLSQKKTIKEYKQEILEILEKMKMHNTKIRNSYSANNSDEKRDISDTNKSIARKLESYRIKIEKILNGCLKYLSKDDNKHQLIFGKDYNDTTKINFVHFLDDLIKNYPLSGIDFNGYKVKFL